MSNARVPATAGGMPDPAADLAHRIAAMRQREEDHGTRSRTAKAAGLLSTRIYNDSAESGAGDAVDVLRDMLTITEATSLLGAAVQIAEAISRVATIVSCDDEREIERDHRAADRLLYSALRALEAAMGTSLDDIPGAPLVSRNCDPWTPVEERLAAIEAKGHGDKVSAR